MRNIPVASGLVILTVYLVLSLLAWYSVHTAFQKENARVAKWPGRVTLILSILQSVAFCLLFIYPFNTASTTRYSLYFIYNSILLTDLFVKIPLALGGSLTLLCRGYERIRSVTAFMSLILASGTGLLMIWGFTIGPRMLYKNHITIKLNDLPEQFDGFRITQISDTHLGNFHYGRLLDKAMKANQDFNPELLVFTGDLVNNFSYETNGWAEKFNAFQAKQKVAIPGNHDYGDYFRWKDSVSKMENRAGIMNAFGDLGFRLLMNQSTYVARGNDTIYVAGVENWGHAPFPQYADLPKTMAGIPSGSFIILLSHDPSHWYSEIRMREGFPLTLSGHSHGLQWGIKLAGLEFSLIYLSRKNWAGLYRQGENHLYVNRGLGTIGIPFRLDMPAEITFITLRKR